MMRKSVAILTPDGGVRIELPQRIRQQADSGHDVQERDLDDFVPLERSLKLPTQHSISDEGAGVLLEINCILGHMIGDLLGHHRPGQLLRFGGSWSLPRGGSSGEESSPLRTCCWASPLGNFDLLATSGGLESVAMAGVLLHTRSEVDR